MNRLKFSKFSLFGNRDAPNRLHNIRVRAALILRGVFFVIGLVEEEVGGELFVLVAGKVRLNRLVTIESKST